MNPFLNLIWLLCGGIFTAIEYLIASLLMMVTIIGIPFGFQTLKLAGLALWPFGKEVRSTPDSGGCLSIIMSGCFLVEFGSAFLTWDGGFCFVSQSLVYHSGDNTSNLPDWLWLPSERLLSIRAFNRSIFFTSLFGIHTLSVFVFFLCKRDIRK